MKEKITKTERKKLAKEIINHIKEYSTKEELIHNFKAIFSQTRELENKKEAALFFVYGISIGIVGSIFANIISSHTKIFFGRFYWIYTLLIFIVLIILIVISITKYRRIKRYIKSNDFYLDLIAKRLHEIEFGDKKLKIKNRK